MTTGLATSAPAYFDQSDMVALLGQPQLEEICDDADTGAIDTTKFNKLGNLACSKVDAALALVYAGPFPITQTPVPALVVEAATLWMKALLYAGHPEKVRQYGSAPMDEAQAACDRLTEAKNYLTDWLASPKPRNIGGLTYNQGPRMVTDPDPTSGNSNLGDF